MNWLEWENFPFRKCKVTIQFLEGKLFLFNEKRSGRSGSKRKRAKKDLAKVRLDPFGNAVVFVGISDKISCFFDNIHTVAHRYFGSGCPKHR